MLSYALNRTPGEHLYSCLYRQLRADILAGRLRPGEKLPSKRSLAEHLHISKVTVENAYAQLAAEGYIQARERAGFFVEDVPRLAPPPAPAPLPGPAQTATLPPPLADFTANDVAGTQFPFSVWSRLMREVILDCRQALLEPLPREGVLPLREAIARSLYETRGMRVRPDQILVGAGTDFLYNLLVQLLGRELCYGFEDPGYRKIAQVYRASGAACRPIPMDEDGVCPNCLDKVDVLHISPSHHFPTGLVMPIRRRQALLAWAAARSNRWLIEDDYDSEFRFSGRPIPSLQAIDPAGRVIYLNTFTKSLAPSIRIGYLVLPPVLLARCRQQLGFYSCTVPSFEQYTLARFLERGFFEKHVNRMRKIYRGLRNQLIDRLQHSRLAGCISILEQDAGLHFLLQVRTEWTDRALEARCAQEGLRIRCLSAYCAAPPKPEQHGLLVLNYSGLPAERIPQVVAALERALLPAPPPTE